MRRILLLNLITIYGDLILEEGATLECIGDANGINLFGEVINGLNVTICGSFDDMQKQILTFLLTGPPDNFAIQSQIFIKKIYFFIKKMANANYLNMSHT